MELDTLINEYPDLQPVLSNLPKEVLDRSSIQSFPAGSILQKKDNNLIYFFIIYKGRVQVINEFDSGNSFVIEENNALDFVGDVAALAGKKLASVTTKAITDCHTIRIPLASFNHWIRKDNDFLLMLSKRVANKLYASSSFKGFELYYPATHLMLKFFLDYEQKIGFKNANMIVDISRQEIGETIGVSVRTVNRALRILKDEELISINKSLIHIDKNQLLEIRYAYENNLYC